MRLFKPSLPSIYQQFFRAKDGTFNQNYLLHFQILSPARDPDVYIEPLVYRPSSFIEKLMLFPQNTRNHQEVLCLKIRATEMNVWSLQNMYGSEYENGYFQSMVARAALRGDLISGQIELQDVPTHRYSHLPDMPKTLSGTAYYICPDRLESATRDMLSLVAQGYEVQNEPFSDIQEKPSPCVTSHRGIGLIESLVQQKSVDMKKIPEMEILENGEVKGITVGAGEIYQCVFWFTNERAFQRTRLYLGMPAP